MASLEGLLGGVVSAEMIPLVAGVIARHGGLSGLVSQFEKQGLGDLAQSWVESGRNLPITVEQIHQVLGDGAIAEMAAMFGLNPHLLAKSLARILPRVVATLTRRSG